MSLFTSLDFELEAAKVEASVGHGDVGAHAVDAGKPVKTDENVRTHDDDDEDEEEEEEAETMVHSVQQNNGNRTSF